MNYIRIIIEGCNREFTFTDNQNHTNNSEWVKHLKKAANLQILNIIEFSYLPIREPYFWKVK